MSILLGIDPGSRFLGYGVIRIESDEIFIVDQGVFVAPRNLSFPQRLQYVNAGLRKVILEHRPTAMALEKIFLGKNADSAFKLGQARGVCLLAAVEMGLTIHEYAARSVKKAVTGSGSATKEHVRLIVSRMLRLNEEDLAIDASDALSLAICHKIKDQSNVSLREREQRI